LLVLVAQVVRVLVVLMVQIQCLHHSQQLVEASGVEVIVVVLVVLVEVLLVGQGVVTVLGV
jgi:hypothetical protein